MPATTDAIDYAMLRHGLRCPVPTEFHPLRPVEPSSREDDGLVECPACASRAPSRLTAAIVRSLNGCETCVNGRASVVDAIAWELERWVVGGQYDAHYPFAGGWPDDLWRWAPPPADRNVRRPGITTSELARRLAPVWRWVRAGVCECVPQAVDRTGERPAPNAYSDRDYSSTGRDFDGIWTEGTSVIEPDPWWYRVGGAGFCCRSQELARRQSADPCVLSTGRVIERAWVSGRL